MNAENGFMPPEGKGFIAAKDAKAVIIPFGLEKTVSYEGGTSKGPKAILQASPQLEYFDEVFWCEAVKKYGIATLQPTSIEENLEDSLNQIEHLTQSVLDAGKFPLILGGEHSLTAGAIRAFAQSYESLTILQFDAHADLRDGYDGQHYSHAAAMRRCLDHDNIHLTSIGVRNISAEEVPYLEGNKDRVSIFWAKNKKRWELDSICASLDNNPVYITFDVDAFDSSLMPATGTPEPGGLQWQEVIDILNAVSKATTIVGADIVELAPRKELHACDFLAAKLAYKILSYALLPRKTHLKQSGDMY